MNELYLYGEVGWDITIDQVKDFLDRTKGDITLNIASPGGYVFDGYAIYNLLKNSGRVKEAHINGLCGSIMTLIVNSADKIVMSPVAQYMIHNPFTWAVGEVKDMEKAQEILAQIKDILIGVYEKKTGKSRDEISDLMDKESWYTAEMAKEEGFIDEVSEEFKAVAKFRKSDKMDENKKEEAKGLIDQIKNLLKISKEEVKNEVGEPNNMLITLEDGTELWIDSEDGEIEGKNVFIAENGEKTEEAAPDGTHRLDDGREIVVSDGVITEVKEDSAEDTQALKDRIAELEAELAEANTAEEEAKNKIEALEKESKEFKESQEQKFKDLEEKITNFENTILGEDKTPPKKDLPKQKTEANTKSEKLNQWLTEKAKERGILN